jgi:RNA polymerase primary sigma factor
MKQLTITNRLTNRETESFKLYLKDIAEIDILTPAEESICAMKASRGDKAAKDELIRRNLRFVVSVAKQYATSNNPLEDLVNEGNIGLIIAADKFKPEMGWRFISYGVWWIRKIIYEHLSAHSRMVRLPVNKINSLSKLDKKINELEQRLGRTVDIRDVITEYGEDIIPKGLEDLEDLSVLSAYSMDSLDREIGGDEGSRTTLADLILDENSYKSSDHLLVDSDFKEEIRRIIDTLKPRDKRIMVALYGLNGETPLSLKEVGDEVGVTRETIRQIKEKTLKTLKARLSDSSIRGCL